MIKEGYVGVVKGTKNQEAAEFFINTYLSPDAQAKFAMKVGVVPVVPGPRAKMAEDSTLRELVVLDPARINNMVRLDAAKIDLSKWNDEWNRTVAAR
jgi:spermidine/putrescine-binding protein